MPSLVTPSQAAKTWCAGLRCHSVDSNTLTTDDDLKCSLQSYTLQACTCAYAECACKSNLDKAMTVNQAVCDKMTHQAGNESAVACVLLVTCTW